MRTSAKNKTKNQTTDSTKYKYLLTPILFTLDGRHNPAFSIDRQLLITSSWSPLVQLWQMDKLHHQLWDRRPLTVLTIYRSEDVSRNTGLRLYGPRAFMGNSTKRFALEELYAYMISNTQNVWIFKNYET